MNAQEIRILNDDLLAADSKDSKLRFILLATIDDLIYYIKNFIFLIKFVLTESSYIFEKWSKATKMIKR